MVSTFRDPVRFKGGSSTFKLRGESDEIEIEL